MTMFKQLLEWAKKVREYKKMTTKDIKDKTKEVEDQFAERCRNWCDKYYAVLEEIFAYDSFSFTATSVVAWRLVSLTVTNLADSYRFELSSGVKVEMRERGSASHPNFVHDHFYKMDSSGCIWVRVLTLNRKPTALAVG